MIPRLIGLTAVAALIFSACGDDDDDDDGLGLSQATGTESADDGNGGDDDDDEVTVPGTTPGTVPGTAIIDPDQLPGDAPSPSNVIAGDDRGLYLYTPDDGELAAIEGESIGERAVGLDWFPDGASIAAFGQNLVEVPIDGSESTLIWEPLDLAFGVSVSPDGGNIAFDCAGPGGSDVCIVPSEPNATAQNLTEDAPSDHLIGWLDDENILLVSSGREGGEESPPVYDGHLFQEGAYFVVNVTDGRVRPGTEADVNDPLLSPEGLWRFVVEGSGADLSVRLENGDAIEIPVNPDDFAGADPAAIAGEFTVSWSNGDVYATVVQRNSEEVDGFPRSAHKVWLVDLNEGTVELVAEAEPCQTDLDCTVHADWSPDSSSLAIFFGITGD
ncbi:MAG: hypothetical protein GEU28_01415 [Dehalococcoidia bacterium]|nr:hypothetical protein [Dehalococcoidia bacterium]